VRARHTGDDKRYWPINHNPRRIPCDSTFCSNTPTKHRFKYATTATPAILEKVMAPFAETHGPVGMDVHDLKVSVKLPSQQPKTRCLAKDWSGHLTDESAARRPSALKAAFKHLTTPGLISLGGGLPLAAYFPIQEVNVTVPTVGKWSETETAIDGTNINIVK